MLILDQDVVNKKFEDAMKNWNAGDSIEKQDILFTNFIKAELLIPVTLDEEPVQNKDGVLTMVPDTGFHFPMIEAKDGKVFLLAFTSQEEFKKYADGTDIHTIQGSYKDFVYMLDNARNPGVSGVVINPFNESITIFRELLLAIKDRKDMMDHGHANKIFAKGQQVVISEPKNQPVALIEAVKQYMESNDAIKAGYLRVMITSNSTTYLLVVDHDGEEQEIFDVIAECAKPYLRGMMLDLINLDTELGEKATTNIEAFYQVKEEQSEVIA